MASTEACVSRATTTYIFRREPHHMEVLTKALTVLMVVTALHVSAVECLKVDVASHLHHLSTHRYPTKAQTEARQEAAEYIIKRFEESGLRVELQSLVFAAGDPDHAPACPGEEGSRSGCVPYIEGVNVIGASGPVREEAGAVVVVGAAYDTDNRNSPVYDNGAGVAVLLEVARLYQATAPRPHLTTLFVAFDLSVERYDSKTRGGLPGAWSLVQDYLRSFVGQNVSRLGGAILLGPLMNVNPEAGSQGFDSRLQELFPAAHRSIASAGHRGDFLAMVTRGQRGSQAEKELRRQVAESYTLVGGKLIELSLDNHSHTQLPPALPPRQAAYFWGSTYKGATSPLPAILLTDTESSRSWPPDASPNATDLTAAQRVFLDTTVMSLVHFLVQRQSVEDWWEAGLVVAMLVCSAVNLVLLLLFLHLSRAAPATKGQEGAIPFPNRVYTLASTDAGR